MARNETANPNLTRRRDIRKASHEDTRTRRRDGIFTWIDRMDRIREQHTVKTPFGNIL